MNNRLYSQFLFGVKIAFLNSYPPVSGDQVNVISTCTLAISLVVVVQYGTLIALKRKPQVFENFQKIYKKNLRRHKCLILLPQFRVISHSLPRSKQLLKWNCLFPQFNKSHILTCTWECNSQENLTDCTSSPGVHHPPSDRGRPGHRPAHPAAHQQARHQVHQA